MTINSLTSQSYSETQLSEPDEQNDLLNNDVLEKIFIMVGRRNIKDLNSCACVCKNWNRVIKPILKREENRTEAISSLYHGSFFGRKEWESFFGTVPTPPFLPDNFEEFSKSPRPIWDEMEVRHKCMFLYIPDSLNGAPLTIANLKKAVGSPLAGNNSKIRLFFSKIQKILEHKPITMRRWVLITTDVLPESRKKGTFEQLLMVKSLKSKTQLPYRAPGVLETLIAIFARNAMGGAPIFTDKPSTYTQCAESVDGSPVLVGGFNSHGVAIFQEPKMLKSYGIAAAFTL